MRRALLLLLLLGIVASRALAASAPDISKPLLTQPGAEGCESADEVKKLQAATPGTAVDGCYTLDPGTRGYFMDEQSGPPRMIALDIKVDFRERLLWVPANALRNP